jgi:hypothetical protein
VDLERHRSTHEFVTIDSLVQDSHLSIQTGHEIGKMAYGTGDIPFIRTSDLSNWELKADPKHSVSLRFHDQYSLRQNVRAEDVLLVRDGTYLVGNSAMVTESDLPMLYQSHLLRFRMEAGSPIDAYGLLGLLNSSIVRRQLRARQFTADIIDTIGNRYLEIALPLPTRRELASLSAEIRRMVLRRSALRRVVTSLPDMLAPSHTGRAGPPSTNRRSLGFRVRSTDTGDLLVPKYHDPQLRADVASMATDFELVSLSDLMDSSVISASTGVEVGKMAYGTGGVPFVRTSDISNLELKSDPKQNVADSYLALYPQGADVRVHDILLVRDGTYLVGSSAMVTADDLPMLYAGGLYRLRSERPDEMDPYLLLLLLNTQIVKRQIRARQFTRDIIDTIGRRLSEVVLPVPKDRNRANELASSARAAIAERALLRQQLEATFASLP